MVKITDLRKELEDEKKLLEEHKEIEKLRKEKTNLEKEIKSMRFNRKYGKHVEGVKSAWTGAKKAFNKISYEVGKIQENQIKQNRQKKAIKKRGNLKRQESFIFGERSGGLFG